MKHLFIFYFLLVLTYNFSIMSQKVSGKIFNEVIFQDRIEREALHFFHEDINYVEGGITFTYPLNFFEPAPVVTITLEYKDLVYTTSEVAVPVVTANSATETTVRVNIVNDIIQEAQTNDVAVCLDAVGTFTVCGICFP